MRWELVARRKWLWVLVLGGWGDGVWRMGSNLVESRPGLYLAHLHRGRSWVLQYPPCCCGVGEGDGEAAMRGAKIIALWMRRPLSIPFA